MSDALHILILEDQPVDAELVLREVRKEGIAFTARRVETEKEFLRGLREFRPGLILADYSLPTYDGMSALALVQKECPDVPFILVSGTLGEETAVESLHLGATDYILKQRLCRVGKAVRRALLEVEKKDQLAQVNKCLRDSEVRYRRLFEAAKDGMVILDAETGVVLDVNPFLTRLIGSAPEEVLGKNAWELGCFRHVVARHAAFEAWRQENIHDEAWTLEASDGRRIDVEVVSNAYLVSDRKVIQINLRDITERKQAAEALRASEKQFQRLFESSRDAIMTLDPPFWRFTSGNPATVKMFGARTEQEFMAHGPWELSPPRQPDGRESAEKSTAMIETALREGSHAFEWTHRRIGGEEFAADVLLTRMEVGPAVILQATVRDIGERKRAEESLRLQSAALHAAADTIVITNREAIVEWVNPAFTQLTGYSFEDALGRNLRDLVGSGTHSAAFFTQFWETILDGRSWHGEIVNRRKDGSLYTESQAVTPIRDAGGAITHFVAIKEDITARLALEAQFRQAQKMECVGQLASGIAHDFNNLLTVINGTCELVLAHLPEGDPAYADVQEVHRSGQRAAALTRQLLALSRQQIVEPQVLSFNTVVSGTEDLLRRLLGEDIDFVFAPTPGLACVKADRGQIEQVITNLAVNARDAMPHGGRLTIQAQNVTVDETDARHGVAVPPGAYAVLTVSDTGVGMDEVTRARMFEPFFTTKGPDKGTGLGLSTVYGIVKQSHGFIWAESEVGDGTTFKIFLPQVPHAVAATRSGRDRIVGAGTETILLVEDNLAVRKLAARILGSAGYTVLDFETGAEALSLMERHEQPVQLLLSDVVMPGIGGRELAERLARICPEVRVLYMSGYTSDTILRDGVLDGRCPFLQKPFTADTLRQKVREMLD